jgi:ParB family transcriptional regulator, chromosome partitioning protein
MARLEGFDAVRNELFLVNPEDLTIVSDKAHPLYDERANLPIDSALVNNIMVYGVKQNVLVAKEGQKLLVVAGRQRVRCAIEANKRLKAEGKALVRVPVTVQRGEDADKFGVMISENEIRQGDGILTKAEKLRRFLDMGRTADEAAIAFGVTRQAISNWLSVLDLAAPVREAVKAGQISASAAAALAKLAPKEQGEKLAEILKAGKPTIKAAKKIVARGGAGAAGDKPERWKKADVAALINRPDIPDSFVTFCQWIMGIVSRDFAQAALPWMRLDAPELTDAQKVAAGDEILLGVFERLDAMGLCIKTVPNGHVVQIEGIRCAPLSQEFE